LMYLKPLLWKERRCLSLQKGAKSHYHSY
jgi:hypothetical protein